MLFSLFGHFFSSGHRSFLVLSAPLHAGSPTGPRTQVWALAVVRGACSGGSKWKVRSARDSRSVGPSRPMQTHEHNTCSTIQLGLKKWQTAHAIPTIFNAVNVARHCLVMERYFPDTYRARHATNFSTIGYNLLGLGRIVSSYARFCAEDVTTRCVRLFTYGTRTVAFQVNNTAVLRRNAVREWYWVSRKWKLFNVLNSKELLNFINPSQITLPHPNPIQQNSIPTINYTWYTTFLVNPILSSPVFSLSLIFLSSLLCKIYCFKPSQDNNC